MDNQTVKYIIVFFILTSIIVICSIVQYPKIKHVPSKKRGLLFRLISIVCIVIAGIGTIFENAFFMLTFTPLALFFLSLSFYYFSKTANGLKKIELISYLILSIGILVSVLVILLTH